MKHTIYGNHLWSLISVASLISCVACASHPQPVSHSASSRSRDVQVAHCGGPAFSLPPALRATLPPRTGRMDPDDKWADIAETIPGGFAGIIYDQGKPAILLTHPEKASIVKQLLASRPEFGRFDIANAHVIKVRWDFAQLVDWYNYLMRSGILDRVAMSSGDKNEGINRIRFGVQTESDQRQLVKMLTKLGVPCDLITVGVEQLVQDT